MTQPTHNDISRAVGNLEGSYRAMENRMGHLEKTVTEGFDKVGEGLDKIDKRLAAIEKRESERKGAWKVVAVVAATVSGAIAWVVNYFFGGA